MDHSIFTQFFKAAERLVKSRSELEKYVKPGDIFLSTMAAPVHAREGQYGPSASLERVFRAGSRALQGDFTHSGMYVGGGKILELRNEVQQTDMREKGLERSFPGTDAIFLRPNLPAKERRAAAERFKELAAEEKAKKIRYASVPYLLKVVANDLTKGKLFRNAGERETQKNRYICSNVITHVYDGKLKDVTPHKDPLMVIPRDFLESDQMKKVVTYRNPRRYDRENRT